MLYIMHTKILTSFAYLNSLCLCTTQNNIGLTNAFRESQGIYIHTTTTIYLSEIGQVILCDAWKRKFFAADFMFVAF